MANESIESFITPEKIEDTAVTIKSHRRASIGGDSLKKSSTGKPDSAKNNRNVVPNYLRASTGSCHDFCKHGIKHSSDEKEKKLVRKRIVKPSPDELPVTIIVSGEKNKEKAVENHISLTGTKNPSPERKSFSPRPKLSLDNKKVIKNKPSVDATKNYSPDKKAREHKNPLDAKNKSVLLKLKPSTGPPEIVKSVFFPSKTDEHNKVPSKSKPVKAKLILSSSSDNLDGVRGKGQKNSESNMGQKMTTTSKASAKKVSASPRAAAVSTKLPTIKTAHNNSRKGGNVNKNRVFNKPKTSDNEKVDEKILHVVEMENKNVEIEPVSSVESLSHENSSVLSSLEEDDEETKPSDEVISKNESLEINHSKTEKRIKVVENRTPVKLKFRNGKVMDVQSNSSVPRKLRFRRARVIGADEIKSDLRRSIFKKAGVSDDKARVEVSSEKVVLKHQELQAKKDGQGLLNNDIIEQTASRLVESRKSKVKALVGAFETVISLQEGKATS
ncbi:hypothetical protein CASFOL_032855 [Castilleja foliolosa]|uniref:Calmodulin-binding domain-containing protein n=1 Tax=Castilleja foliolosa TaxID=1961234 RepID=A0ABD3C3Z8_9LAMI